MLATAGLSRRDVVNLHVTLSDIRDFPAYEAAFRQTFEPPYPSGTVVGAPLQQSEMLIQMESIAIAGGGETVEAPDWPDVLGWASPAMVAGDILYVSGCLGLGAGGVIAAGAEAQTRAAWDGVRRLIDKAGFHSDSVLRTNNVLTDWRSYGGFNAGYGASVSDPYPPRATVLGQLIDPRAHVQVEAIAHRGGEHATIVQAAGFQ
jgi:enamine deaminase RidA (YjgF/YER057c/UK114 family)